MWARLYTALQLCVVTGCQVQVHTLCTLYTLPIQHSPTESPPAGFPPAAHSVSLRRVFFWFNSIWRHENGAEQKTLLAPKIEDLLNSTNNEQQESRKCGSQFSLKISRECYCAISQIKKEESQLYHILYKRSLQKPRENMHVNNCDHKIIFLSSWERGFVIKIGNFYQEKKLVMASSQKISPSYHEKSSKKRWNYITTII